MFLGDSVHKNSMVFVCVSLPGSSTWHSAESERPMVVSKDFQSTVPVTPSGTAAAHP